MYAPLVSWPSNSASSLLPLAENASGTSPCTSEPTRDVREPALARTASASASQIWYSGDRRRVCSRSYAMYVGPHTGLRLRPSLVRRRRPAPFASLMYRLTCAENDSECDSANTNRSLPSRAKLAP